MPNTKKITVDYGQSAITSYCIIRRETDSFRLNDADGTFAAAPVDPYLSLAEDSVIKGRYEVSESRQVWNDGKYTIIAYKQTAGSPAPASDAVIGSGVIQILADTEINSDAKIGDMHDEAFGKWALNSTTDVLTLYRADGTTVLKTFNLTETPQDVPAYITRTPV